MSIVLLLGYGGPNADTGRCMVSLGPNPATDMCPETATHFVQVSDPFGKWNVGTIVCTVHRDEVRASASYQNDYSVLPEVVSLPPGL